MTLNNVVARIQTICLAHNQVRHFAAGMVQDFLTDKTTKYPAVFLQDNGGRISISAHATTLNYRLFFVDLVHVSEDTKANEQEVHSDQLSIAEDIITQINNAGYTDWRVSGDNAVQLVVEEDSDMYAGVVVDITISKQYTQNSCEIPSDLAVYVPATGGNNPTFDLAYIATGTEGTTLTIAALLGKKILLVVKEGNTIHKVSNLPIATEYTWNNTDIVLGVAPTVGQRFLILYREY